MKLLFMAGQKNIKEQLEELEKRFEEVDKADINDETKFISFSKIQLEWLEEELQEALAAEDYQWAENVRKEIERVRSEER